MVLVVIVVDWISDILPVRFSELIVSRLLVDLCPGGRREATGDPVGPDGEVPEGLPAVCVGAGALVREDNDGIPSTGLVVLRDIAKIANLADCPSATEGHETGNRPEFWR